MSKKLNALRAAVGIASAVGKYNIGKSAAELGNSIKKNLGGKKFNMTTGEKISAGLKKYWRNKKRAINKRLK